MSEERAPHVVQMLCPFAILIDVTHKVGAPHPGDSGEKQRVVHPLLSKLNGELGLPQVACAGRQPLPLRAASPRRDEAGERVTGLRRRACCPRRERSGAGHRGGDCDRGDDGGPDLPLQPIRRSHRRGGRWGQSLRRAGGLRGPLLNAVGERATVASTFWRLPLGLSRCDTIAIIRDLRATISTGCVSSTPVSPPPIEGCGTCCGGSWRAGPRSGRRRFP